MLVIGISFVTRSYDVGSAGPANSNGYSTIVLPENSEVLWEQSAPVYDLQKTKGNLMLENTDSYSRLYLPEGSTEPLEAYARIMFSENPYGKVPCDVSEYDYFTLEFDLSCTQPEVLSCDFYMVIGTDYLANRYKFDASYFEIENITHIDESMSKKGYLQLTSNSLKTITAEKAHIVFVCDYDKDNSANSRLQIKVNNQIYYDSVLSDADCFPKEFTGIFEIRFRFFESFYSSDLLISNLKVTGYNDKVEGQTK